MKTKNPQLVLNGSKLQPRDIVAFVSDPSMTLKIADSVFLTMAKSRHFVDSEMEKKLVYGINTGFGPMASQVIGKHELVQLQKNLIRSHAVGAGAPIDSDFVLAAMIVRLNTLIKGYSGVSKALAVQLATFINHRITPIVPEHGAVGTSGDLVQLAHIALGLIGEGEVHYKGTRAKTSVVLQKLGIKPYELKPKEGLSLINGTSTMTGISTLLADDTRRLLSYSVRTGALALELVSAFTDSFSIKLQEVRPHPGQIATAAALRKILRDSKRVQDRKRLQSKVEITDITHEIPHDVQEVYSLRCIPQILGPVVDALSMAEGRLEIEMNSVSDNPIVDWQSGLFLHGGNFHGDYIASAVDHLKATLVKLTMLSERRTNYFLNANVNKKFPPFQNLKTVGLNLALQGLQFVSTSTTARSQSLAFPHYVHSIPTNGDNQDIVSMGTDAALIAQEVIENAYVVVAIELVTLVQAIDYLDIATELGSDSRRLYDEVRKVFPKVVEDRTLSGELNDLISTLKKTKSFDLAWSNVR